MLQRRSITGPAPAVDELPPATSLQLQPITPLEADP
jgi:hypothetical protein